MTVKTCFFDREPKACRFELGASWQRRLGLCPQPRALESLHSLVKETAGALTGALHLLRAQVVWGAYCRLKAQQSALTCCKYEETLRVRCI